MTEIARIRWRSLAPTEVDEELVVFDDERALLVVRTSRLGSPTVGTFAASVSPGEFGELRGQRLEVDPREGHSDPVITLADGIAMTARGTPLAAATFHSAVVPGGGFALQAVGSGDRPARFELDPGSVIIHVERGGQEIAWHEHPILETGFVSPAPEGLGGVGRPAEIEPGAYGTIALSDLGITGSGEVAVELHGWLRDELPEPSYERFRVRTAAVPLPA